MANAATDEEKKQGMQAAPVSRPSDVPHTRTESTLAPTSEFVRYLLLALPSRYVFRGFFGTIFNDKKQFAGEGILSRIESWLHKPGAMLQRAFSKGRLEGKEALAYNAALGVGSMALTWSYSNSVYRDIHSLFSEAVGEELGKPADQVRFSDLRQSSNQIVQRTIENYREKLYSRLAVDALFFPAALMRNTHLGDFVLGLKGVQALMDTWQRKTSMFEDLVTFVNNKINPRNGLGQTIGVGEVFDLYQHYAEVFKPQKMFRNVLERGTGEGVVWAKSQPVFQRIADLMNNTYAYKHHTVIDPTTGHSKHLADFTLPKFIHLLGHDLIDPHQPEKTLAYIEIANSKGIAAVKQAQQEFESGAQPADVLAQHGLNRPETPEAKLAAGPNAVIAKGSTTQVEASNDNLAAANDHGPTAKIDTASIARLGLAHEAAPERSATV